MLSHTLRVIEQYVLLTWWNLRIIQVGRDLMRSLVHLQAQNMACWRWDKAVQLVLGNLRGRRLHSLLGPCCSAQFPPASSKPTWWQTGVPFPAATGLPLLSLAASYWWCCSKQRLPLLACYQGAEPTLEWQSCRWRRSQVPEAVSLQASQP